MKHIAFALLVCSVQMASAQFNGKLTYKIVNSTSTLIMVYYQNGNNARVDARSVSNADSTKLTNVQDTLLFDIAGLKMTHLNYQQHIAYLTKNTATLTQQVYAAHGGMQSAVTIQTVGPETVNGYSCTHYVIVGSGPGKYVSKRDIWITPSLGTPGIQVAGGYLYYTPDFPQEIKLQAAGATGVVVKSSISAPGLTITMNLVAVDTNTPGAGLFSVPAWYTVQDKSNVSF